MSLSPSQSTSNGRHKANWQLLPRSNQPSTRNRYLKPCRSRVSAFAYYAILCKYANKAFTVVTSRCPPSYVRNSALHAKPPIPASEWFLSQVEHRECTMAYWGHDGRVRHLISIGRSMLIDSRWLRSIHERSARGENLLGPGCTCVERWSQSEVYQE